MSLVLLAALFGAGWPALQAGTEVRGAGRSETVRIEAGARLRSEPDPRAASLALVDEATELRVLERRGDWVEVAFESWKGWVRLGKADPETAALEVLPRRPAVDAARLDRARSHLSSRDEGRPFASFVLYTDVSDAATLAHLERITKSLPPTYEARYGLDTGPPAGEAIVLFAQEADYRRLEAQEIAIAGLESGGHAGHGIAAINGSHGRSAARSRADVAAILIHEVTHLLNRRALGIELPPWLEEGTAEDLAYCRVDGQGRVLPGTLRGERIRTSTHTTVTGAAASVDRLVRHAATETMNLKGLLHEPWRQFVSPEARAVTYPSSAMLVRYLLDGGGGANADAFRAFLRSVAEGGSARSKSLLESLGTTWPALEGGFAAWLRGLAS